MALNLDKDQLAEAIESVQQYFEDELEVEIGELKARLLIDFFLKEIGPTAYNHGVADAESYFREKLEDLRGSCFEPRE